MKKMLILVTVFSLTEAVLASPGANEAGIWCPPKVINTSDNVILTASAVTVFEIQANTTPTYILCFDSAAQPSHKMTNTAKNTTISSLLPEPTTIALLGLSGFLMRRRKASQ